MDYGGIMDKNFNWLLKPKYTSIYFITSNLYKIKNKGKKLKIGIFHKSGKWIIRLKEINFMDLQSSATPYYYYYPVYLHYPSIQLHKNFVDKISKDFLFMREKRYLNWWEKLFKKEPSKFEKEFGLWAVMDVDGKQLTDYKYPYPPLFINGLARMPLVPKIEHLYINKNNSN